MSTAPVRVIASGRIAPAGESIRVAAPVGAQVARLSVKEGDSVEQDQTLATLSSYPELLAKRDLAASELSELKTRSQTQKVLNQGEILQAQFQVDRIDTPEALQIQAQQAAVRRLTEELTQARIVSERTERLYQRGALPLQDSDSRRLAVQQAQENLIQAEAVLAQLDQSRETNLQIAQSQVQQVTAESALIGVELASARQTLAVAEAQLQQSIVKAPQSGQILQILTRPGEAMTPQGILTMGNTQQMTAVAEVFEADVSHIRLGQTAQIKSPALAEVLEGQVSKIGQLVFKNDVIGDDPTAQVDARVVEVVVALDSSTSVVNLTNLQVDIEIEMDSTQAERPL
ncbi:MAG: HlyD family efflux transporter periplasmic adaptor subunit [Phormidesmis sp.]